MLAGTFGMAFEEILKFGIAMNIFAGLGHFFSPGSKINLAQN